MNTQGPLPQEGGSFIRNADGSLRPSGSPAPIDATEPTAPEADTTPEPTPPSRRASRQTAKDA